MIKSVIIDHDIDSTENLINLIDQKFKSEIHVFATARNIEEGLRLIDICHPSIVFLDIEMPDLNGFSFLETYNHNLPSELVITTASQEHAINAIQHNVFGYIVKPVAENDLLHVVSKFQKKWSEIKINDSLLSLNTADQIRKIPLTTMYGLKLIDAASFLFAKAEGAYTIITTTDGQKTTISKSLKEFEKMTAQFQYFRTHKSFIINLHHVVEFNRKDEIFVVLRNNIKVPISVRRKEEFLQKIKSTFS